MTSWTSVDLLSILERRRGDWEGRREWDNRWDVESPAGLKQTYLTRLQGHGTPVTFEQIQPVFQISIRVIRIRIKPKI